MVDASRLPRQSAAFRASLMHVVSCSVMAGDAVLQCSTHPSTPFERFAYCIPHRTGDRQHAPNMDVTSYASGKQATKLDDIICKFGVDADSIQCSNIASMQDRQLAAHAERRRHILRRRQAVHSACKGRPAGGRCGCGVRVAAFRGGMLDSDAAPAAVVRRAVEGAK